MLDATFFDSAPLAKTSRRGDAFSGRYQSPARHHWASDTFITLMFHIQGCIIVSTEDLYCALRLVILSTLSLFTVFIALLTPVTATNASIKQITLN